MSTSSAVEYDAKALESALAKLRAGLWILTPDESAALLARLETADKLAGAIESYRTFEDVTVSVLDEALAAYRALPKEPR